FGKAGQTFICLASFFSSKITALECWSIISSTVEPLQHCNKSDPPRSRHHLRRFDVGLLCPFAISHRRTPHCFGISGSKFLRPVPALDRYTGASSGRPRSVFSRRYQQYPARLLRASP